MNNIYYVTNKKPLSHNKSGSTEKHKNQFRDEFNEKFSHLYSGLPITNKTLQSNIVYIHQLRNGCVPDVDNLSKPLVDTFTGIIYEDDELIIKRSASIIALKDFDFVSVNATYMPLEIFEAFNKYYIEVGQFDVSQIKIGEL